MTASGWNEMIGRGFTPHGFAACINGFPAPGWKPESVVLHKMIFLSPERDRLKNLEKFRAIRKRPHEGFRLLVTDETIWVLNMPAPESESFAIEILGDFDTEPWASHVRENVVTALVALYARAGLPASAIQVSDTHGQPVGGTEDLRQHHLGRLHSHAAAHS